MTANVACASWVAGTDAARGGGPSSAPDHVVDAATDTARDIVHGQSRDQRLPDNAQHDVVGQPVAQTFIGLDRDLARMRCDRRMAPLFFPSRPSRQLLASTAA